MLASIQCGKKLATCGIAGMSLKKKCVYNVCPTFFTTLI